VFTPDRKRSKDKKSIANKVKIADKFIVKKRKDALITVLLHTKKINKCLLPLLFDDVVNNVRIALLCFASLPVLNFNA